MGKKAFECEECGFKYADKQNADRCEKFCKIHRSCSMEITKNALR